ncbi:MAG: hydroxyacid dehydrogenase [Alphaproteobacteria bacterium]
MADIVISEFMDERAVDSLRRDFNVLHDPTLVDRPGDLSAALADSRGLIVRNRTRVDGGLLARAPKLQVIGRLGVGLDNIDLETCKARGIEVCPATGANAATVAEYVIAAVLILLRGAFLSSHEVIAGAWPREALVGREVAGKRLGLVGFGGIARRVAERATALGMKVAAHDPYLAPDDAAWIKAARMEFAELLRSSDAVSLHVPLSPGTRNLIDGAVIAGMRTGAVLVNTARGGVVDEEALVEALRSGKLAGAALDVFANEPLDARAGAVFADVPNLLLTPHVAGITEEANLRVSAVTAENVRRVLTAE